MHQYEHAPIPHLPLFPLCLHLVMNSNANPLSAKLTKLLSSSLDDPKLRTSLTALSDFYTVNAVNSRHNLRGDIERRGTEVNYEFLKELEKVNLVKSTIHLFAAYICISKQRQRHPKLVLFFSSLHQQFLELEEEMSSMNSLCQEMQDRLNFANDKTITLLEQTDALREQRQRTFHREVHFPSPLSKDLTPIFPLLLRVL